jgi:hypothetical protein
VAQHTLETVAQDDYRAAGQGARVFGHPVSAATVGRLLEREGEKLQAELFGPEASLQAAQTAPPNRPPFLIVSGDGSRYRTHLADRPRGTPAPSGPPDENRDRGWRENKIGVVIRAEHGKIQPDGEYLPPPELLKTYVATTDDIHAFSVLYCAPSLTDAAGRNAPKWSGSPTTDTDCQNCVPANSETSNSMSSPMSTIRSSTWASAPG